MNPSSQPSEPQDVHLQEADISVAALWVKVPNDMSLPADQVIAEQSQEKDAEEHLTPHFIP